MTRGRHAKRACPRVLTNYLISVDISVHFLQYITTRGHARFARSPLVIRLGDSRIRLGDSGYREVLNSECNYKIGTVTLTEHYRTIFSLNIMHTQSTQFGSSGFLDFFQEICFV